MNDSSAVLQQWVDIIEPLQPATEISPLLYALSVVLLITLLFITYLYFNNDQRKLKRKLARIRRNLVRQDYPPGHAARSVYRALTDYFACPALSQDTRPQAVDTKTWQSFCQEIDRQCFSAKPASSAEVKAMINHAIDYFK
jgi:hypothetical protein